MRKGYLFQFYLDISHKRKNLLKIASVSSRFEIEKKKLDNFTFYRQRHITARTITTKEKLNAVHQHKMISTFKEI